MSLLTPTQQAEATIAAVVRFYQENPSSDESDCMQVFQDIAQKQNGVPVPGLPQPFHVKQPRADGGFDEYHYYVHVMWFRNSGDESFTAIIHDLGTGHSLYVNREEIGKWPNWLADWLDKIIPCIRSAEKEAALSTIN